MAVRVTSSKLELELENVKVNGNANGMRYGSFVLQFTHGKFTESEISDEGIHKGNLASYHVKCVDPPRSSSGA